jgi:heme oxygenase
MHIEIAPDGLAQALRTATRDLHVRAERTGVVADMLNSRTSRHGYALLLRNLLPAYRALEAALDRHRLTPGVGSLALKDLYRADRLVSDLSALYGAQWNRLLPLLPAAERYALAVASAAEGAGDGLAGHAYVRYLGDLSGGQILKRLLAKSLGLSDQALSFYAFPQVADIGACKMAYIQALDRLEPLADRRTVTAAAVAGFAFNIEISEGVHRMAAPSALQPQ